MSNRLNFRPASLTERARKKKTAKKSHPGVITNLKNWLGNIPYNLCSRVLSKTIKQ